MKWHGTDEKDKWNITHRLIEEVTGWVFLALTVPAVVMIPTISLLQCLIVGLTRVDGFVGTENPSARVGRNQIAPPVLPVRPCTETLSVWARPDATGAIVAYTENGVNRKR